MSSSTPPQPDPPESQEQTQARLDPIVATAGDAVDSKNHGVVVQSSNAAAYRIFSFTAAAMIGQPILAIIPPDRQHEKPQILDRLMRGERVDHFETVRRRKDGRLIDISVT